MKGKLIMTVAEATDNQKWLEMRQKGIGGSDIAIVAGLNPWKSMFQLWAEKTGEAEQEDLSDNEYVYWGTVLEELVAKRFCELTGKSVRKCGMLQDEEVPYFLANIDRSVVGENAGLECKTASSFKGKEWKDDEIPDAYYAQCQWYMGITGCEKWYIACLLGGNKFIWKEIPRNDSYIEELRETGKEFWRKVEAKEMPEVDGSKACSDALQQKFINAQKKETIVLGSEAEGIIARLDQLAAVEKSLKNEKDELQNRLKLMIGNAEIGIYQDRKVNWLVMPGKVTIDSKRLLADLPEVHAKYTKTGKPYRQFKLV